IDRNHLPVIGMSYGGGVWGPGKQPQLTGGTRLIIPRPAELRGKTLGATVRPPPGGEKKGEPHAPAGLPPKTLPPSRDHGIVLNLHNHTYEVVNDMHDLKGTLERIPDVKLGPDLNWLIRGGVDPVWFIHEYGDRIVFLHLRDQKADGNWSEAMGEGVT